MVTIAKMGKEMGKDGLEISIELSVGSIGVISMGESLGPRSAGFGQVPADETNIHKLLVAGQFYRTIKLTSTPIFH